MPEENPFDEMTDAELSEHLNSVLNEQEKRARLAVIPDQIKELGAKFVTDGGDMVVLKAIF